MNSDSIPGSKIFFRINCLSIYRIYSDSIPDIISYTLPTTPNFVVNSLSLKVDYQYNKVNLSFLDLDYSDRNNKDVYKITVRKSILEEIPLTKFESYTISSPNIFKGDQIVVFDYVKKSLWYGVATENFQLYLSSGCFSSDFSILANVEITTISLLL